MGYFDDMEDYRYRPIKLYTVKPLTTHYTEEKFVENVDGRFEIRKTVCGLEFSQSSGRLTRTKNKTTCKECQKLIHTNSKQSTKNA